MRLVRLGGKCRTYGARNSLGTVIPNPSGLGYVLSHLRSSEFPLSPFPAFPSLCRNARMFVGHGFSRDIKSVVTPFQAPKVRKTVAHRGNGGSCRIRAGNPVRGDTLILPVARPRTRDYAYTHKAKPGPSGRIIGLGFWTPANWYERIYGMKYGTNYGTKIGGARIR